MIPKKGLLNQQNANREKEGGNNKEFLAGRQEHEDEKGNNRENDRQREKIAPTGGVGRKEHVETFDGENEEGLDEVEGVIGLRQIKFIKKQEVDRGFYLGHEGIEEVEVGAFETGLKNAVKHQDNDDLDRNIDGLGDDRAGVAAHHLFDFLLQTDLVGTIFFLKLLNLLGNGEFFAFGAVKGEVEGQENDTNNEGKENDGDAHIRVAKHLTDEPVETDEDVEKGLVDIGNKDSSHGSKYTPPNFKLRRAI